MADAARFARVRSLAEGALERPPETRDAWLREVTAADHTLAAEVRALVAACARASDEAFLATPDPVLVADALARFRTSAPEADVAPGIVVAEQYEILDVAGRGGMATVYRAHDRKHDRTVALKLLHAAVRDPDAGARFDAEIRLSARLNHPGIVPLFDSGELAGRRWFVMPFIAGESLAARLRREGPLPVREAVRLLTAVAHALSHAHRDGVVHRDIKPGNILLRDGEPLLADFGIAAVYGAPGDGAGTPGYMSPEQRDGRQPLDARSDVYALGCVLHEMLAGRPPFDPLAGGDRRSAGTAPPPSLRTVRRDVPSALAALVRRALSADPEARPADATAFAAALLAAMPRPRPRLVAIAALVMSAAVVAWAVGRPPPSRGVAKFVLPDGGTSPIGDGGGTLMPDGKTLVFVSGTGVERRVYLRPVDALDAQPVPGTEGAVRAFVSPDGRQIGFVDDQEAIRTVPITGGASRRVASSFRFVSADWSPTGPIVFWRLDRRDIAWVSPSGGDSRALTQPDTLAGEMLHHSPKVIDDGRLVVFMVQRRGIGPGQLTGELAVVPLDTARKSPAGHEPLGIRTAGPLGLVDGWLLHITPGGRTIEAIRFDAKTRRVSGTAVEVLQDRAGGISAPRLASNGTLLYTRRETATLPVLRLPDGREDTLPVPSGSTAMNPRLSADGRRALMQVSSAEGTDAWEVDLVRRRGRALTRSGRVSGPTWIPSGGQFVFLDLGNMTAFRRQDADPASEARVVLSSSGAFAPEVVESRGELVFQRFLDGRWHVWAAPLDGSAPARPLLPDTAQTHLAAVSPDGQWLAYVRDAGRDASVWIRRYDGGPAIRLLADPATEPRWAPDGRSVVVRSVGRLRAVGVSLRGTQAAATTITDLGPDEYAGQMPHTNFDVLPDGRGLLLLRTRRDARPESIVVLDWLNDLRRRLRAAA